MSRGRPGSRRASAWSVPCAVLLSPRPTPPVTPGATLALAPGARTSQPREWRGQRRGPGGTGRRAEHEYPSTGSGTGVDSSAGGLQALHFPFGNRMRRRHERSAAHMLAEGHRIVHHASYVPHDVVSIRGLTPVDLLAVSGRAPRRVCAYAHWLSQQPAHACHEVVVGIGPGGRRDRRVRRRRWCGRWCGRWCHAADGTGISAPAATLEIETRRRECGGTRQATHCCLGAAHRLPLDAHRRRHHGRALGLRQRPRSCHASQGALGHVSGGWRRRVRGRPLDLGGRGGGAGSRGCGREWGGCGRWPRPGSSSGGRFPQLLGALGQLWKWRLRSVGGGMGAWWRHVGPCRHASWRKVCMW